MKKTELYEKKLQHFNLLRASVAEILPCPVAGWNKTSMRKESFESNCRYRRKKKNLEGVLSHPQCKRCKLRHIIDAGEPYKPPKMIWFINDAQFEAMKKEYTP